MRMITYRLDNALNLEFSTRNILIKLKKGSNDLIFERGIFFTTDAIQFSIDAKEILSLSYSPKHAFAFDYKQISCRGILYTNNGDTISHEVYPHNSRVWPAFGHLGGASEFILTDSMKISEIYSKFSNPNKPFNCPLLFDFPLNPPFVNDIFHQDDTSDYTTPILLKLSSIAFQAIKSEKLSFPENGELREYTIGSIKTSSGVSIRLSQSHMQTIYSLSIGIKCDLSSKSIQLMLWGYAWQDWKLYRFYVGPTTYSYIWRPNPNSGIQDENELKRLFLKDLCERGSVELKNVASAIGVVLNQLKQIDDTSLRISHQVHLLPI